MGYPFIDKPLTNVSMSRICGWVGASDLCIFFLAFRAVSQQIIGIACPHDPGASQSQGYAGCVNGDPATTPLFCHVSSGARTTGRIQNQVTWVSGHEYAALNDFGICLDDIDPGITNKSSTSSIKPNVVPFLCCVVFPVSSEPERITLFD